MKIYVAKLVCACAFWLTVTSSALALSVESDSTNKAYFGIEFPDGNSFYARTHALLAISKSEYIVSNAMFVTEITLSISGSPNNVRIYNVVPVNSDVFRRIIDAKNNNALLTQRATNAYNRVENIAKEGIKKIENVTGSLKDVATSPFVHKDYPSTTHAGCVEFAIADLNELNELYQKLYTDFAKPKSAAQNSKEKLALDGKIYRVNN